MSENTNTHGLNFIGALTIAFIVLKLTNCITWSWWWVLSPLWLPVCFMLFVALVIFIMIQILSMCR